MSGYHVERLRRVRDEFNAAREALSFLERSWHDYLATTHGSITITPRSVTRAAQGLEGTYIVRLHAEFEGVLRDHLVTTHKVKVPANAKVAWLISRVRRHDSIDADPALVQRIEAVRDYRNAIAHADGRAVVPIRLSDAVSYFATYVSKLPDP